MRVDCGRVMKIHRGVVSFGVCLLVAMHPVAASAQVVVGSWRLDVGRSELNAALNAFRDTFRQQLVISLIDGAVRLDLVTTGVSWQLPYRLALTPGCCLRPPPQPGSVSRADAIDQQFKNDHVYLADGVAHSFNVASDVIPPPTGLRTCVWLANLTGFDVSEDWLRHHRSQRFRTSVDGSQLTIDAVETSPDGPERLVRVFVREP